MIFEEPKKRTLQTKEGMVIEAIEIMGFLRMVHMYKLIKPYIVIVIVIVIHCLYSSSLFSS